MKRNNVVVNKKEFQAVEQALLDDHGWANRLIEQREDGTEYVF